MTKYINFCKVNEIINTLYQVTYYKAVKMSMNWNAITKIAYTAAAKLV